MMEITHDEDTSTEEEGSPTAPQGLEEAATTGRGKKDGAKKKKPRQPRKKPESSDAKKTIQKKKKSTKVIRRRLTATIESLREKLTKAEAELAVLPMDDEPVALSQQA